MAGDKVTEYITKPHDAFLIGHNSYFSPFGEILQAQFKILQPGSRAKILHIGFQYQ